MKEEHDSILDQVEDYIKINQELYTLKITEKVAETISSVFSRLIIGLFAFLFLFMLTMGLSYWLGELMGHTYMGFLMIGGVVGLVALLLYWRRNSLLLKPIMDSIIVQLLK